jgi:hypothetical protein
VQIYEKKFQFWVPIEIVIANNEERIIIVNQGCFQLFSFIFSGKIERMPLSGLGVWVKLIAFTTFRNSAEVKEKLVWAT